MKKSIFALVLIAIIGQIGMVLPAEISTVAESQLQDLPGASVASFVIFSPGIAASDAIQKLQPPQVADEKVNAELKKVDEGFKLLFTRKFDLPTLASAKQAVEGLKQEGDTIKKFPSMREYIANLASVARKRLLEAQENKETGEKLETALGATFALDPVITIFSEDMSKGQGPWQWRVQKRVRELFADAASKGAPVTSQLQGLPGVSVAPFAIFGPEVAASDAIQKLQPPQVADEKVNAELKKVDEGFKLLFTRKFDLPTLARAKQAVEDLKQEGDTIKKFPSMREYIANLASVARKRLLEAQENKETGEKLETAIGATFALDPVITIFSEDMPKDQPWHARQQGKTMGQWLIERYGKPSTEAASQSTPVTPPPLIPTSSEPSTSTIMPPASTVGVRGLTGGVRRLPRGVGTIPPFWGQKGPRGFRKGPAALPRKPTTQVTTPIEPSTSTTMPSVPTGGVRGPQWLTDPRGFLMRRPVTTSPLTPTGQVTSEPSSVTGTLLPAIPGHKPLPSQVIPIKPDIPTTTD